jgi:hypothetical protein
MISLCEVNLNLNKFQIIYEYLVKNFTIMMQKEDKTVKTRSADLIYVRFAHPYAPTFEESSRAHPALLLLL